MPVFWCDTMRRQKKGRRRLLNYSKTLLFVGGNKIRLAGTARLTPVPKMLNGEKQSKKIGSETRFLCHFPKKNPNVPWTVLSLCAA